MKLDKPKTNILQESDDLKEIMIQSKLEDRDITNIKFMDTYYESLDEKIAMEKSIFQNCKLLNCSFLGSSFTDIIFQNCDFSNTNFSGSDFVRVQFINCKLIGTNFSDNIFHNTEINESIARYSNFSNTKFEKVLLSNADLQNASMQEMKLKQVEFNEVNFKESIFFRTPLNMINFTSCEIDSIVLDIPDLKGAIVSDVQAIGLSKLIGLEIK